MTGASDPKAAYVAVPSRAELERLARDLSYRPVGSRDPRTLDRPALQTFDRDGFLAGLGALDGREIDHCRRLFDTHLASARAAGHDGCSLHDLHLTDRQALELLRHPVILGYVRDLVGTDVVGWDCHYFGKSPRDLRTIPWHRDACYWPLTPARTVSVWLALDDADAGNACLRFLPGSHLDHRPPGDPSQPLAVDGVLAAGEISIHSDLVLHGSGANASDRPRRAVILRYCPPTVRAELGWSGRGIVVHGQDPTGRWNGSLGARRDLNREAADYSSPSPTISRSV